MSSTLPMEVERYIVAGNPGDSIRSVTAAVERGEFGYDVLKMLVHAIASGREPRFAVTKPIPARILEFVKSSGLPPIQAAYVGVRDGLWAMEDAETFVQNHEALSLSRKRVEQRSVYMTRKKRAHRNIPSTEGRYAKISLDAVLNGQVCDGAKACLALLVSLAGAGNRVVTYTKSLATQLGRTTRTIRNYFIELEAAGLIKRSPGKQPNTVKIEIDELCKPEPYKEPLDIAAFKLARRSSIPSIRKIAESVTLMFWNAHKEELCPEGGRKQISAFNSESITNERLDMKDRDAKPQLVAPTSYSTLLKRRVLGKLQKAQVSHDTAKPSHDLPTDKS